MRRDELRLALLAFAAGGAFAAIFVTGVDTTLGNESWFGNGSNVIQWISGPMTLAAIVTAAWIRWNRKCAVPVCFRLGEHPVDGTLGKVCRHHHTRRHHERVFRLHGPVHAASGRLGHGESHDLAGQPPR